MKNIAKTVLLPVVLSIACFGGAIAFFQKTPSQPAIASNIEVVSQQMSPAPSVTSIGEVGSNRSYRLTIHRPQDLIYVQCPENYAPKFGYIRNVEAIQCERFQPAQ